MAEPDVSELQGRYEPRFAPLVEAAREVLAGQGSGLSLAVIRDGTLVVDLWGGTVAEHGLVHTWSTIKPVTATCLLLTAHRNGIGLTTPVREIWPELHAASTGRLTVGGLLAHRAGLSAVPFGGDVRRLVDADAAVGAIESATPEWEPGEGAGEHALTYGILVGELVRRIDGRSLGAVLRDEIANPLRLDLHLGLGDADLARAVDLDGATPSWWRSFAGDRPALLAALGTGVDGDLVNGEAWRRAEIGAVNGHVTARALAGFWAAVLEGDLPRKIIEPPVTGPEPDLVLGWDVAWTQGSAQYDGDVIGMGGVGGSYGAAIPQQRLAWAFLTTRMGDFERLDHLEAALRTCL